MVSIGKDAHKALHTIFNHLTPYEQICFVLGMEADTFESSFLESALEHLKIGLNRDLYNVAPIFHHKALQVLQSSSILDLEIKKQDKRKDTPSIGWHPLDQKPLAKKKKKQKKQKLTTAEIMYRMAAE